MSVRMTKDTGMFIPGRIERVRMVASGHSILIDIIVHYQVQRLSRLQPVLSQNPATLARLLIEHLDVFAIQGQPLTKMT